MGSDTQPQEKEENLTLARFLHPLGGGGALTLGAHFWIPAAKLISQTKAYITNCVFLKQSAACPGPLEPGDCFIMSLIFVEVVPESSPCTSTNRVCSNKGDKVVLGECLRLSVLLKMNAVQFTIDGFELLFFSTISTF